MSETPRPIAHAVQNPDGSWRAPHDLADHLAGVAALAAGHARIFGANAWAHLAGAEGWRVWYETNGQIFVSMTKRLKRFEQKDKQQP